MDRERKIYECGTLRYTLGGVILTSALIMFGFFCHSFAATVVTNAVTLRVKSLGASDTLMAIILTTIAGVFNMTVCPAVSFKSDRYRGKRWGRRIYFIISTLPMFCAAMLLFGFSGYIGDGLAVLIGKVKSVSPAAVTLGVIALVMVMYQFYRMFVASVIYYIYNDVIPQQFQARVIGAVQVVTVASGAIFNFWFFHYCKDYFTVLLVAAAVVYAVGVGVMCFFVKEPVLPPLTETEKKQSNGGAGVLTFMRESFSHPFYWYGFVGDAFWSVATAINTYLLFFYMEMGIDLAGIGKISGIAGIVGMFLSIGIATVGAIFVDRWHPFRVNFYARVFMLLVPIVGLKWIFFTPSPQNFFWIYLVNEIVLLTVNYVVGISGMPRLMRIFPKSRFGQFSSAGAMFRSILVLIMGLVLGGCIDLGRVLLGGGDFVYRFLWVWRAAWTAAGLFFLYLMYREWQKLGGATSYRAPAPWSEKKFEEMENSEVVNAAVKPVKLGVMLWDITVFLYVAGALAFAWFFRNEAGGMQSFILWTTPAAAVLAVIYLALRLKIISNLKHDRMERVPHHGLLLLTAVQQLLILGAAFMQSFLCGREAVKMSAQMYCFELIVGIVSVALLWFSYYVERAGSKTVLQK